MIRLSLLVLFGCAPRILYVIPDPQSHSAAESVASAINAAGGRELVSLGVGPNGEFIAIRTACGALINDDLLVSPCAGEPNPVIIVHELGHAFGLGHSADPASVMFERYHAMDLDDAARSLVDELR